MKLVNLHYKRPLLFFKNTYVAFLVKYSDVHKSSSSLSADYQLSNYKLYLDQSKRVLFCMTLTVAKMCDYNYNGNGWLYSTSSIYSVALSALCQSFQVYTPYQSQTPMGLCLCVTG